MKRITTLILVLFFARFTSADPAQMLQIVDSAVMDRIALDVVYQAGNMNLRFNQKNQNAEDRPWRNKHPVAFGALVGFGCGAGYITFVSMTSDDINVPTAMLFFGGIGAGAGALIGSFF